jgi:5-methylcytosine-specific restriction protein A
MRIGDLPASVTASKADWLPGTTWLGFTPQGQGPRAAAQCQTTVRRQFGEGYVLERITQSFGEPNAAFANDAWVKEDRERHEKLKDRLVAVYRLRASARPLAEIIGKADFERLQDIWSAGERHRWSVAFPIVESYEIVGQPRAHDVFSESLFKRIYLQQSATLRILDDEAREAIADLEIIRTHAANAWIAIEDQIAMAERSEISPEARRDVERDLAGALEGETDERRTKIKKRAAWLADRFVKDRRREGRLICDECSFDPRNLPDADQIRTRSCLDVHHTAPLDEQGCSVL